MRTVVLSEGQIVIPSEVRAQDGIVAGQRFQFERLDSGEYILRREIPKSSTGLVDQLLSCPEKGWFQPLPDDSTDSL